MQLATFYADVAGELRRGNSADVNIPRWTRAAVNFLESGHSFRHMQKFAEVTTNPQATNSNIIAFPNVRVKSWEFLRKIKPDGTFFYLSGGQPYQQSSSREEEPTTFWHDGVDKLYLNAKPVEASTYETLWYEYTDWPTSATATPIWLVRGYNVLLSQTLLTAGRSLRDQNLVAIWAAARDEAVKIMIAAEEESVWRGTTAKMGFTNAGL